MFDIWHLIEWKASARGRKRMLARNVKASCGFEEIKTALTINYLCCLVISTSELYEKATTTFGLASIMATFNQLFIMKHDYINFFFGLNILQSRNLQIPCPRSPQKTHLLGVIGLYPSNTCVREGMLPAKHPVEWAKCHQICTHTLTHILCLKLKWQSLFNTYSYIGW